jgi:hypothetical protein
LGLYARRSYCLSPFLPGPPLSRPKGAGTHDDVPAIEWLRSLATAHSHTPSCTQQGAVFQGFVTCLTLTTHSSQIAYSQQAPFPSDWWLPSAAVNNLEPLPPSQHIGLLIESLLLVPMRNHTGFTRPSLRLLRVQPLEDCTHASLALASLSAS